MAIVKSHLCKSCGGLLNIDLDRQLYVCPFCGLTYDYEYFREDNVLDLADRALYREEFGSAKEAYEFVLQKDPHNFPALRGIVLCSGKWKSMSPIALKEEVNLEGSDPALLTALENAPAENREFFENIRDSLNILSEYRRNKTDLNKLKAERDTHSKQLNQLLTAKAENNEKFSSALYGLIMEIDELDRFKLIPIAIGILAGIVYATWKTGWWLLATIAVIAVIIAACYKISKALTNRSLNAEIKPVQEKVDKLKSDCDKIAVQNKELREHYKELTQKIVAADTEYLKATSADDTDEDDLTGSEDTSAED